MNRLLRIAYYWTSYLPAIMIMLLYPQTSGPLILAAITTIIIAVSEERNNQGKIDVPQATLCFWTAYIALDNVGFLTATKDFLLLALGSLYSFGYGLGAVLGTFMFDMFLTNPLLYLFIPFIIICIYLISENSDRSDDEKHQK